MKKATKGYILAAAFAVLALVGHVSGFNQYVVTKFSDVQVEDLKLNGNDILDSAGTTRITVGATTTVTGTVTASNVQGFQWTRSSSDPVSGTATAVGIIAISSASVVYVSTGTGSNAWVKVGSQ